MQTLLGPVPPDLRDSLLALQMEPEVIKFQSRPSRSWESSLGEKADGHLVDFLKSIILYESHLRFDTEDALKHAVLKDCGDTIPSAGGKFTQPEIDKCAEVWKIFGGSFEELGQFIRGLTSGEMPIDG